MTSSEEPPNEKEPDMIEELRAAIRGSRRSLTEIGEQSGVGKDQLSRFLRGERGLTFVSAARVCAALGVSLSVPAELQELPKGKPRKPKQPK